MIPLQGKSISTLHQACEKFVSPTKSTFVRCARCFGQVIAWIAAYNLCSSLLLVTFVDEPLVVAEVVRSVVVAVMLLY